MTLKNYVLRETQRLFGRLSAQMNTPASRERRSIDAVLAAAMLEPDLLSRIHYPVAYAQLLRETLEPWRHRLNEVKRLEHENHRFDMLCDALRKDLPALDYQMARQIATIADEYRGLSQPIEFQRWAGDVGLHFSVASSFGQKGRILFNIVRFMKPSRCLELGTAYGMSALFILSALKTFVGRGCLVTVEGWPAISSLSFPMLKEHYGEMVSCVSGSTRTVLAETLQSFGKVDFVFHDANHTRQDYIDDFAVMADHLASGAIVVVDDIRYEDPRVTTDPRCYEGWQAICSHPRVARAVEVDDAIGFLLMS